jgi:hypothetical protein
MTDNITPEAVDNDFSPATMDNDTIYIGTRKYVAVDTIRALSARVAELEAERDAGLVALFECMEEIDAYIKQEYPHDHPVQERYRQRDYAANPARIFLQERPDALVKARATLAELASLGQALEAYEAQLDAESKLAKAVDAIKKMQVASDAMMLHIARTTLTELEAKP